LSRAEGQNESGKALVFAALTLQPYEGLYFCAFCQVELEKEMRSDVFLFSLNEGAVPFICYKYTSFFDSGKFVPCQIWKDVVFF
jgi:hypothetical protein